MKGVDVLGAIINQLDAAIRGIASASVFHSRNARERIVDSTLSLPEIKGTDFYYFFFFTFKIEIELIKLTGALNRNGVKCLSAITVVTFHQLVAVQNLNFESNVPAFFLLFPRVRAAV